MKNKFPGKNTINSKINIDKYYETIVTFNQILDNPKINNIHKPNYQGSLIEEKVEGMILEYLEKPELLRIKDKIIIGCLRDNWYIVDGQHRLEMARILSKDHNKNDTLLFSWYMCDNELEMRELFNTVNKDSIKNSFYIDNNDFKEVIILELISKLKDNFSEYFSRKKSEQGKKYTIEEFIEKLREKTYFDKWSNSNDCYQDIRAKNEKFYNIVRYSVNFKNQIGDFYKDEYKSIEDKIIFSLKRNNFVDYLIDQSKDPWHNTKKQKIKITTYKKRKVWENEFGENKEGKCPISFCNTLLINKKGVGGWQCGHIISEYNGGETEVYNMRPICAGCNQSMGSKNWSDYDKKI